MMSLRIRFIYIFLLSVLFGLNANAKSENLPYLSVDVEIQKEGFQGEAFEYVVKLISSSPEISNVRVVRNPVFPSSLNVIQGITKTNRAEIVKIKGKELYSWTIARYFVIPETPGKYTISAGDYVAFIPHEKLTYHPFWGNRRTVEYEEIPISSKSSSIQVKNLPTKGKSDEYTGGVGDFRIEGWFPPGNISVGQDAYVVFKINGYGSLQNFRLPNIYKIFGKGCHLKEADSQEEQMQRDGRLFSEITLTCKFVADEPDFTISPLCMQFFNPEKGKFYVACSEELQWKSQAPEKGNKIQRNDAIAI